MQHPRNPLIAPLTSVLAESASPLRPMSDILVRISLNSAQHSISAKEVLTGTQKKALEKSAPGFLMPELDKFLKEQQAHFLGIHAEVLANSLAKAMEDPLKGTVRRTLSRVIRTSLPIAVEVALPNLKDQGLLVAMKQPLREASRESMSQSLKGAAPGVMAQVLIGALGEFRASDVGERMLDALVNELGNNAERVKGLSDLVAESMQKALKEMERSSSPSLAEMLRQVGNEHDELERVAVQKKNQLENDISGKSEDLAILIRDMGIGRTLGRGNQMDRLCQVWRVIIRCAIAYKFITLLGA